MKYYKIIKDNSFIGVVYSGQFIAQGKNTNKLFFANETTGQLVKCNDEFYHDYWMVAIENSPIPFTIADIIEITEEEYNTIKQAIDDNEEIIINDDSDEEEETPVIIPEEPDITLEYVRTTKINQISKICRITIENGFDLELRGETHHFSLDTQDQLNLISLSAMAQTQSLIPYHADGEMCIFYTAEEMNEIVETATAFKVYHTTYYNALKGYINALDTIEDITAIEYGTPIPEEYKSDVLKALEQ